MTHKKGKNSSPAKNVKHRLNRIQGQIKALDKMLADKRDCEELLNQIAAARSALLRLAVVLVEDEASCQPKNMQSQKKVDLIIERLLKIN